MPRTSHRAPRAPQWKINVEEEVSPERAAETFAALAGQIKEGSISVGSVTEAIPGSVDAIVRVEDTPHHTRVMLAIEWERASDESVTMSLADLGLTVAEGVER